MNRLIYADMYKTFHRDLYYMVLILLPALAITLVLAVIRGGNAGTMTGAYDVAPQLLQYPLAVLPLLTQMTIGEEFHERTIKNTIEYGTSRNVYFSSKLISTLILGMILLVAVYAAYFCTAYITLPQGRGVSAELMSSTFVRIGAACAIYAAAAAMSMFLLTVFNKNIMSIFVYYGAIYVTGLLLQLFHLGELSRYLLNKQISALANNVLDIKTALLVAAVTFIIFAIGGIIALRKKDLA
jgi:hypothetical protein